MGLSILLMVLDHRYHQTETLRAALSLLTYPVTFVAQLPGRLGDWVSDTFETRAWLQARNRTLEIENLKLRARLQKMDALEAENERLRDLLGSAYKIGDRVLVAELVSMDLDPFRQQVKIDKGTTSGVYEGQAVLDAHAVMGQVTHVDSYTATVLLITDPEHAVPVQILRNGLRTIAVGTGRIDALDLPYLPNNADVRSGDLLVTSGLGGKFPPGYPVGRITAVERMPGKPFAHVTAAPLAHLDRAREVLLVWEIKPPPEAEPAAPAPQASAESPAAP